MVTPIEVVGCLASSNLVAPIEVVATVAAAKVVASIAFIEVVAPVAATEVCVASSEIIAAGVAEIHAIFHDVQPPLQFVHQARALPLRFP